MKKINIFIICIGLVMAMANNVQAKNNYNVDRIWGKDRYKTSINICNKFSNEKLENIIIANGNNFPDALSGSILSKRLNAPILLVDKDVNHSVDCINYINKNLKSNGNIYILGGNASVGEKYINKFKKMGYNKITRLGGKNRFDTNKTIVNFMNVKKGTPLIIVNGYGFADALSVSSVSASRGYPILMSDCKQLPSEIKLKIKEIQPSKIFLIGGQGALNNKINSQIKDIIPYLNNNDIVRIGGSDKYDTSLEICKYFNLKSDTAIISNGNNFPDALSGSALASKSNSPIILTDGKEILNQKKYLDNNKYKNLILLGGMVGINELCENILKGNINELDITKSKSNYNFTLKDNSGEIYSIFIYSDDKQIKSASFSSEDNWSCVWAAVGEGDRVCKGHFKMAVFKEGKGLLDIYNLNDNKELVVNLDTELIRVHKNKYGDNPDFLLVGTPQTSNFSSVNMYYIKDGKVKQAKILDIDNNNNKENNYIGTFNCSSLFFNQKEKDIFETATYDNAGTFYFYIHSWKFDIQNNNFIYLGTKFMNTDEYFNYVKNIKK